MATDHPATTTIAAQTITRDVIDNDPVTLFETVYTKSSSFDDATWLMAGNDPPVCLWTRPLVDWPVDRTQVTTAER